jgi:hypothetical protein
MGALRQDRLADETVGRNITLTSTWILGSSERDAFEYNGSSERDTFEYNGSAERDTVEVWNWYSSDWSVD